MFDLEDKLAGRNHLLAWIQAYRRMYQNNYHNKILVHNLYIILWFSHILINRHKVRLLGLIISWLGMMLYIIAYIHHILNLLDI